MQEPVGSGAAGGQSEDHPRRLRRRSGPSLLSAGRLAGRFVWRAARKEFIVSASAEMMGALGLAGILVFARQVAEALTQQPPVSELAEVLPQTIGLGASLAVAGVAAALVRRTRWLVAEQVTRHVQEEIISVATSVDYAMYERQDFNDELSRANAQVAESSYQMAYDVISLINVLATSVVVVFVLVRSVPEVLGILVLIAIPSMVAARLSARLAYQATYDLTPNDRLRSYLFGALSRKAEARELRVFELSAILKQRWSRLYDERMQRIRALVRRQVTFDGLAALIGALLVAGVLLVLVDAAVNGRISVANAAVAIVALQQLTARLRSAASASGSLRQSTFFLDDFARFRDLAGVADTPGSHSMAPGEGDLRLQGVSFSYPGTDRLVLHDIDLELKPGTITALVGLSGGGKTTLAHLAAGLYEPTLGSIILDGVDARTISRPDYWRSVAIVFQDFVRYELTARENISLGDHRRADDMAAVIEAARRAGIERAVERLARGYDTMLSRSYEDGADLSVGQWQRLAVGRAFFRTAPVLILDEPAAALDAIAETRLHERVVELAKTRSVLLISHRFSTVRLADRICVMEAGRITEEGTHEDLLAMGGRYAELFELQARSFLSPSTEPAEGLLP